MEGQGILVQDEIIVEVDTIIPVLTMILQGIQTHLHQMNEHLKILEIMIMMELLI